MSKKMILVIDDEAGFRNLHQFLLEPLGYSVEFAEDGRQGFEMAAKKCYDLILLDMHMPNMNGIEVLRRIKEIHPEQKVIISSSNSDETHSLEEVARKLGAFDCLYKPMDVADIFKVINRALNASSTLCIDRLSKRI